MLAWQDAERWDADRMGTGLIRDIYIYIYILVGGFKCVLFSFIFHNIWDNIFHNIWDVILPIDFHIFQYG